MIPFIELGHFTLAPTFLEDTSDYTSQISLRPAPCLYIGRQSPMSCTGLEISTWLNKKAMVDNGLILGEYWYNMV